MRLVSEVIDENQKILVVSEKKYAIIDFLKKEFAKLGSEIYYSPALPDQTNNFEYVLYINYKKSLNKLVSGKAKYILIYLNDENLARKNASYLLKNKTFNMKIISLSEGMITEQDVDRIIWFIFSSDKESFLHIRLFQSKSSHHIEKTSRIKKMLGWSKKKVLKYAIIFIIFFYLATIPFIILSSYFIYKSASEVKKERMNSAKIFLSYSKSSSIIASGLYKVSRPAYLLFSIALIPDSLFEINRLSYSVLDKIIVISESGNRLISDILKKEKTDDEIRSQEMRLDLIQSNFTLLESDLQILVQKIPEKPKFFLQLKNNINNGINILAKSRSILPQLKDILGIDNQKKYLLLFANNMEIRPGGGFIGSYGILTVNKLSIENIQIFDVYDADGQLKTHIDPPLAIRKYLNQPNWFLRDSAFSFDFAENYTQAKSFLNTEMNLSDFSGGIIITTTAIQNILEATNEVYLPDYDEKVNKDNFYIKTQLHSEDKFFPGSIQKKTFLGSLTRQILLNLDSISFSKMLQMFQKSLDEKQIAMIFENKIIQQSFDSLYWSGKTIAPICLYDVQNCVVDYVFPVDANLGVNKADFFITKTQNLNIKISKEGMINNELIIKIKNSSQNDIFPGGLYKDYFQVSLPPRAIVNEVTKNSTLVEVYDVKVDVYKTIGFLVEIKPQASSEIKIKYSLSQPLEKGEGVYQLIYQKQIGSRNSDLQVSIKIPETINILTQNFSPVVKDDSIIYNTSLTNDKIFILKLNNK